MHIKFGLQWFADKNRKRPIDSRLFLLLREIQVAGSITLAADNIGVSYRLAWGLIREWEHHFRHALIITERGKKQGARLTEFGQTLILEDKEVREQVLPALDQHASRINSSLVNFNQTTVPDNLKIHASHDLVMTALMEDLRGKPGWKIEYEVRGSLNNLKALANHDCDIAGFHFPVNFTDPHLSDQYIHYIKLAHADCIYIATREQGLIVPTGNPKNIKSVRDLTRRSVRFINRQNQSGTRILFDALLEHESIKASQINGYVNEEFTHMAVAAMVASGAADAGMGLEAAGRQFHMDFIPLISEKYCLALATHLDSKLGNDLKKHLASTRFRRKISHIPGYEISGIGKEVPLKKLFA